MYEIPSNPQIEKCIITKNTVEGIDKPMIVLKNEEKNEKAKTKIKNNESA